MATHNSLFSGRDVRRTDDGIAVSVQLPWYRSLWLSAVDDVAASVNGVDGAEGRPALRAAAARATASRNCPSSGTRSGSSPTSPRSSSRSTTSRRRRGASPSRSCSPCACSTCRSCRASTAAPVGTSPTASRSSARSCWHDPAPRRVGDDRLRLHGRHALVRAGGRRRACSSLPDAVRWQSSWAGMRMRWPSAAAKWGWADSATDWREVIARDDIDIVDIVTPGDSHAEIAIAALDAGKHVLCEKPLANTVEEAEAMADAASRAASRGIRSMVGFTYRRVPAVTFLRDLIAEGAIGTVQPGARGVPPGLACGPGDAARMAVAEGARRIRGAWRHRRPHHRHDAVRHRAEPGRGGPGVIDTIVKERPVLGGPARG